MRQLNRHVGVLLVAGLVGGCGDRPATDPSEPAVWDTLVVRIITDPSDLDFSQISGFELRSQSGGKAYLAPLDLQGVRTNELLIVDEAEVTDVVEMVQ